MYLADYQRELVARIYDLLVDEDLNRGVTLYGNTGIGKSTIALGVAEQLQEGWAVFCIEGVDPSLSPYLTWHIGTKLYSKGKLNFGGEISFGINFPLSPISLEFGNSPQREKQSFILTPSEDALLYSIKKQAGSNRSILFIADNYELWDVPSKHFLQKIMLPQLDLLSDFHIAILLITQKPIAIESSYPWDEIPILEISDDNLLSVLRHRGHSGQINIADIRLCAGHDLSLALMAADYYAGNNSPTSNFNEIMDKRCKGMHPESREACKVLESLSIIDSYFTKDETVFFITPPPQDEYEAEYQAEEYLALAEEQLLITGKESYRFTSDRVKSYFKVQLSKREKLYHRKFASYLQSHHPEDYFGRGKHLMLSLQSNDTKIIQEAWQLLFLAYIRRASEIGDTEDVYCILPDVERLLIRLGCDIAETQRQVLNEITQGYNLFLKYQYKNALYHLQSITMSRLARFCLAEVQRLILLCYVQLAENSFLIGQKAEELFDTIHDPEFCEDEQYCRAALVLLDVYIDRSNDVQKARILNKRLIQIIQRHIGRPIFEEFEACYNRKAALYYSAVIAFRQTAQSIQYFRDHHNRNGLYMALCNHSGNAIVSGDYAAATQALSECTEMLEQSNDWYYPSHYKVKNNEILLKYLLEEERASENRHQLLAAAQEAVVALKKIAHHQKDEVSHVIFLNYLGLSILCGSKTWPSELSKANLCLTETDEYYQYFLHDLNFACALLQNDRLIAEKELAILKRLAVPLLQEYRPIFFKRRHEQELLLSSHINLHGDPVKYHEIISASCSHVQDSSCHFYGRGFLLSDLQFLSF